VPNTTHFICRRATCPAPWNFHVATARIDTTPRDTTAIQPASAIFIQLENISAAKTP
jgi:hypothetical protein